MKRTGFLYEKIFDWQNLLLAYKQARSGKRSQDISEFEYDWETSLYRIQQELQNKQYRFGEYRVFKIYEPKERDITCAPFKDRVVHHAICNVIAPYLERSMIVDSYASRKGKGLHKALKRAFYFYNNSSYHYRLDIKKFYYTIDHEVLLHKLNCKFKDPSLLQLLRNLISSYSSSNEFYLSFDNDDLFDLIRERGLPIGNLTSQLLANFYLTSLDHYIREDLHHPYYIRYMDDMIVFGTSKIELAATRQKILKHLESLRLHVNDHKDVVQANQRGVDYLGFRFYQNRIRIRNKNLVRFRRRLVLKSQQCHNLKDLLRAVNGHLGFLKGGHTKRIINLSLANIEFNDNIKKWQFILP